MLVKGIHHIGLYVKNMEKSVAFYTETLGGKVIDTFPMGNTGKDINMVELTPGNIVELLPLLKDETSTNLPWAHIALLTDDIHALQEKILAGGGTADGEIKEKDSMFHSFFLGPEGESIELYQVK